MYTFNPSTAASPRRALLVGLILHGHPPYLVEEHLDELEQLAVSAGVRVLGRVVQQRKTPEAGTFIGRGKAAEIGRLATETEADLVLFDDDLTPSQVKNLEEILNRGVMDRSALILEIFNQRARSREARTQVELARLNYLLPRLTGRWRHLSRQEGGIGVRGGEGEKQLEADRRVLRRRIQRLERELTKIEKTRRIQRRGRRGVLSVALAGYTNAGKSTLFNQLTRAGAHTEDRLFATLDSKLRRGAVDGELVVVFADTVGFIRKLPHHLVSSFRSTMEEVTCADLVLHVIDRSHPRWEDQVAVAEGVLADLGVERERVVNVYNKRDMVGPAEWGNGGGIWISAATGEGVEALKVEVARRLRAGLGMPVKARSAAGSDLPVHV